MWVVDDVKNINRCAVMGQHPLQFPWGFDEEDDGCIRIKIKLTQCITALYRMGIREYQVACDPGIGLYTAEVIHSLKSQCPNIQIVCVLPHEEQATKWMPQLRERYFSMLSNCAEVRCSDPRKHPNAQFQAYQQMIRDSDMLLSVYDPALADGRAEDKAVLYASALGWPILYLSPISLETSWSNRPDGITE